MMSTTVIIILGEVFVVLLGISSFLFYYRWKQKKRKSAEIEKLLDTISHQQVERLSLINQHLKENYALQEGSAEEPGELMIEAEKQFLQQFLKQQIEETSLTDFYTNLCELLDQYLYLLKPVKTEQNILNDEEPLEIAETIEFVENEFDIGDKSTDADEIKIDAEIETGLEDEFAEAEDAMDETPKPETTPEVTEEGLEDEFAESEEDSEPDWGDAFAESGDEVDETTKDSYEADLKKE